MLPSVLAREALCRVSTANGMAGCRCAREAHHGEVNGERLLSWVGFSPARAVRSLCRTRAVALLVVAVSLLVRPSTASSGGALVCDAVNVCAWPWYNYTTTGCPAGMDLVAAPVRSANYTLRTTDDGGVGADIGADDPKEYTPGKLVQLHLRVRASRRLPQRPTWSGHHSSTPPPQINPVLCDAAPSSSSC